MKTNHVSPRFNEEIVEQFNCNEMAVISGGRRASAETADTTNVICPTNGYCPKTASTK